MDNFGLLRKTNLSHVINNENLFGTRIIKQIEDYCLHNKMSIEKVSKVTPSWDEEYPRLNFEKLNDKISISKTKDANKADQDSSSFFIVAITILLLGVIYAFFQREKLGIEIWHIFAFLFLIPLLRSSIIRKKQVKLKSKLNRKIEIYPTAEIYTFENEIHIKKYQIKAVNLFWEDDGEIGSTPKTTLELKLNPTRTFVIDEDGDYLELFRCANEIAKFISKKLNVFNGNSPHKSKLEL